MRLAGWMIAVAAVAAVAVGAPNPVFKKSGITDWSAPPPPTAEPAFAAPVPVRLELANGIRLLVVENRQLPIASLMLVVAGAGAAADPAGKGGLAAFTADLLDEGAGGLGALAIAEEQARLGASISAAVDADAAYLGVSALSKTLAPAVELLTKLVAQPAFDAREVDRVARDRSVALDLLRDRPREVAANMLVGALYGRASAYGHPATGTRASVRAITGADARAFYAERYQPAAMTLVVSGDIDAASAKALLDRTLGAWRGAGKPAAKLDARPAALGKRLLLADRPGAAQSDVRIGLVGIDRKDRRFAAFEVLRTILGDGFTSRIVQKLREELGIIYNGSARVDWRVQPGPFVIAVAIQTPDTARGIAEIMKMLDDLAATPVAAAELEKAKQNIIRELPAKFGTNGAIAEAFGELALLGLPDDTFAKYAGAIRAVTAADVAAVAKAVLPSKKMVVSIAGDLTATRAAIDKLGLGEAALFDPYGAPK